MFIVSFYGLDHLYLFYISNIFEMLTSVAILIIVQRNNIKYIKRIKNKLSYFRKFCKCYYLIKYNLLIKNFGNAFEFNIYYTNNVD